MVASVWCIAIGAAWLTYAHSGLLPLVALNETYSEDAATKFNVRQAEGNGLVAAGGAGLVVFGGVYQLLRLTVWREVLTLQIAGAELQEK